MSDPSAPDPIRVVRLQPYNLEVVREAPGKPWDIALACFEKRRHAERFAAIEAQARGDGNAPRSE